MRKTALIIFLALALCIFCSCEKAENADNATTEDTNTATPSEYTLVGTVTAKNTRIELYADETEIMSGPYSVIINDQTEFCYANGASATLDSVEIGDRVEITYNGQVMLSYPAQIVAQRVVIK